MTGMNPYTNNSPLTGIFGNSTPLNWAPPASVSLGMGPQFSGQDTFEPRRGQPQKQHPWYVTALKEVTKAGLTIGASMIGLTLGGVPGAMIAGASSSALLSAWDQHATIGKIRWGSVIIDGALGLLPGVVGEKVAQSGGRLLTRLTGKNMTLAAQSSIKQAVITGATDGAVMGLVGGGATGAYNAYQEGQLNGPQTLKDALVGGLTGLIGGGIAGRLFSGFRANPPH